MPMIRIGNAEIPEAAIAAEMQNHPAPDAETAWNEAARALAIRQLLLDEAARRAITAQPDEDETEEEATTRALLAETITIPEADDATCRRYFAANPTRFRAPDVYEAAHMLFAPDAKDAATATLAEVLAKPNRFAELAHSRSACPSKENGGRLGQLTRGDLVDEIETFVFALDEGQISPTPIRSKYGWHILRLDHRAEGKQLPYETVAPQIARMLQTLAWQRAVSQYLHILAGRADIEGIDLEGATSPLVR